MSRLSAAKSAPARERVLNAAALLFAQYGYRGVSTRDIAKEAGVNEVTVFRIYRRKHELYFAVLEAELQAVHLRGDLLSNIAGSPNGCIALDRIFHLIVAIVESRPNLVRLMYFGALEMADEVVPLLDKHVGQLVQVLAGYLENWISAGELPAVSPATLVRAMALIVASDQVFSRMFAKVNASQQRVFSDFIWQFGTRLAASSGEA